MRMKFKFLLFLLPIVVLLSGCDTDEPENTPTIIVPDREQLTQTVYADDNTGKSKVTFTTNSAWTSRITEAVKGKAAETAIDWVSITPSSGDQAGDYTIGISLTTNLTGEKRSAAIVIQCNGQTVTITVTQEATTASGEIPTPKPSGAGVLTNVTTKQSVKLTGVTHTITRPDEIRITFSDNEQGNEQFIADFYNPLQNGKLKSGTYTVRAINTAPYPEMKHGDCGWYKSLLGGYGETGTIKVELNNEVYTFTFDINLGEGEYSEKLTGSFTGVPKYLNQEIKIESITLNESEKTLDMGENFTLIATILPENATNQNLRWTTSDTGVARVDENGMVESVGKGTATITVTTEDGNKTANCTVTVNPPVAVESIKVEPDIINLNKGDRYTETVVTVAPENAYNKTYTWKSSNPDVAEYDGKSISAKAAGETTITFTTEDGAKTAKLTVKVSERETSGNGTLTITDPIGKYEETKHSLIEATHTIVSKNRVEVSLKDSYGKGILNLRFSNPLSNGRLSAGNYACVLTESEANNTVYTYELYESLGYLSSGTIAVTVSNDNYTFTLSNISTSNGFTVSGSYTGKLTYTNEYVAVTSVLLNDNTKSMTLGENSSLIATVLPENAFNKTISWSTSKPNIVSVDDKGNISALGIGTATITVTTQDGDKKANCTITVNGIAATGDGKLTSNNGQSIDIRKAEQWVNEKNPEEIEIGFFKENSIYSDVLFTLVRKSGDTGSLKEGTYTTVTNLQASELGIKYSQSNSGTVVVTSNGEGFTVTLNLTAADGVKITGTYTGKIPAR